MDLNDTNYKLIDLKCTFEVRGPKWHNFTSWWTSGIFYSPKNIKPDIDTLKLMLQQETSRCWAIKIFFFTKLLCGVLPSLTCSVCLV